MNLPQARAHLAELLWRLSRESSSTLTLTAVETVLRLAEQGEAAREALRGMAKLSQFGELCWCRTIAGHYCVGQEQCKRAAAALNVGGGASKP